jgi:hypothetical protein
MDVAVSVAHAIATLAGKSIRTDRGGATPLDPVGQIVINRPDGTNDGWGTGGVQILYIGEGDC